MTRPPSSLLSERMPAAAPAGSSRRAGLDGLRAVALLGMLAWHAEVGWVKGGFARMTIFFALSGYLATRSYLRLSDRRLPGTSAARVFGAFWVRRARRLLPMTAVGLVVASGVTWWVGTGDMVASLRGDVLSVVLYASNWRFVAVDRSYGQLFERPSAFQHYWSLSLEEQCFLALPLLVAAAVIIAGRRRAAWVTGGAAVASAALPALFAHTPDAAYYGTHVRAGEFFAGVTLALVLDRHAGRLPGRWARALGPLSVASLAGLALVMVTVDRDLPWLYRGGLGLFALPAIAVIAAAAGDRGIVPRLLGWAPLAAVGRATFSIYVLHWPLFVAARELHPPVPPAFLTATLMIGALAVGYAAYVVLERPLLAPRRPVPVAGRLLPDLGVTAGAAAALTGIVAVAWLVPHDVPAPAYDFAEAERRANAPAPSAAQRRPAVALFGGSTAVSLGAVAFDWADQRPGPGVVPGVSQLGCGVITDGRRRAPGPRGGVDALPPDDYCLDWRDRWSRALAEWNPQLAVLFGGVWETADWQLDGDDRWTNLIDPHFADLVRVRLTEATDLLSADGRRTLLATTPVVGPGRSGRVHEERGIAADHLERVAIYNQLVRQVASANERVDVLNYGDYIDQLEPATNIDWLPDGIHPTAEAAFRIWDDLLGSAAAAAMPPVISFLAGDAPPQPEPEPADLTPPAPAGDGPVPV